jgi:DNA-directed RNA polymerase subunit M/transcription elongation factor TFIIS
MKFCEYCENLLEPTFTNDNFTMRCTSCSISYDTTAEDTLRKERIKEGDILIFDKLLNKAVEDPATEKVFVNCRDNKCSGKLAKRVRIGNDERLYNICITCKFQWLNA